jgi:hypothetical protein
MTLSAQPTYPAAGAYVLRLHRDARPEAGCLAGQVVHVASGDCSDFGTLQQLNAWLVQHAARAGTPASNRSGDDV